MSARSKKGGLAKVNTEGWMMSYADMATILLAMFIVLTVLGKDQTGVSLHKGVESFRESRASFGLPGLFSASPKTVQFDAQQTRHPSDTEDKEPSDPGRSIDSEQERLQRFVNEMNRQFAAEKLPRGMSQATVDLFDRLNKEPPYLTTKQREVLSQVLPLLRRPDYRVTLVVWATMPSDSAWLRAAHQASLLTEEVIESAQLDTQARKGLVSLGQPWRYSDYQRPVLSVIITKTQ